VDETIPGTPGEDEDGDVATVGQDEEDMVAIPTEDLVQERAHKAFLSVVYGGLVDKPFHNPQRKMMYVAVPTHHSAPIRKTSKILDDNADVHNTIFRGYRRDATLGNRIQHALDSRSSQRAEPPIESDITGSNWSPDELARKRRQAHAKYTDEVSDTEEDDAQADAEELSDVDGVKEAQVLQAQARQETEVDGGGHADNKTPSDMSSEEEEEEDVGGGLSEDEHMRGPEYSDIEEDDLRYGAEDGTQGDDETGMEEEEWDGIEAFMGVEVAVEDSTKPKMKAGRYPAALRDDCNTIGMSYLEDVGRIALKHKVERNTVYQLSRTQFTAPRQSTYNDFQSWFSKRRHLKQNGKNDYKAFGGRKQYSFLFNANTDCTN